MSVLGTSSYLLQHFCKTPHPRGLLLKFIVVSITLQKRKSVTKHPPSVRSAVSTPLYRPAAFIIIFVLVCGFSLPTLLTYFYYHGRPHGRNTSWLFETHTPKFYAFMHTYIHCSAVHLTTLVLFSYHSVLRGRRDVPPTPTPHSFS